MRSVIPDPDFRFPHTEHCQKEKEHGCKEETLLQEVFEEIFEAPRIELQQKILIEETLVEEPFVKEEPRQQLEEAWLEP